MCFGLALFLPQLQFLMTIRWTGHHDCGKPSHILDSTDINPCYVARAKEYTFSGFWINLISFLSFLLWHTSIHFAPKYSRMFYVRFLICSGCEGSLSFDCNCRTSVSYGLDGLLFPNELNAWFTINSTSSLSQLQSVCPDSATLFGFMVLINTLVKTSFVTIMFWSDSFV